jgi:hypothetical protein
MNISDAVQWQWVSAIPAPSSSCLWIWEWREEAACPAQAWSPSHEGMQTPAGELVRGGEELYQGPWVQVRSL